MKRKSSIHYLRAFSTPELMVSLAVLGIIFAGVAIAASRYLQKHSQAISETKQWTAYEMSEAMMKGILEAAVLSVDQEACLAANNCCSGLKAWRCRQGISILPDAETGGDRVEIFAMPPQGDAGLLNVEILNRGNSSVGATIRLRASQPGVPVSLRADEFLYIVKSSNARIVKINSIGAVTADSQTVSIDSNLPTDYSNSVLAVRVQNYSFYTHLESDGSRELRVSRGANLDQTETLISNFQSLRAEASLSSKPFVNRAADNCNPRQDWLQRMAPAFETNGSPKFTWSEEGFEACSLDHLRSIRLTSTYYTQLRGHLQENAEVNSGSLIVIPDAFDPSRLGNSSLLLTSGPARVCDESFVDQRCLKGCEGNYKNKDFEPGSDYCLCQQSWESENDSKEMVDGRWQACCRFRDTLQARLQEQGRPEGNNPCQYSHCTAAMRTDNPYLVQCHPTYCSRKTSACFIEKMMPGACSAAAHSDGSDILADWVGTGPYNAPSFGPSDMEWAGFRSDVGKFQNYAGSPGCDCASDIYKDDQPLVSNVGQPSAAHPAVNDYGKVWQTAFNPTGDNTRAFYPYGDTWTSSFTSAATANWGQKDPSRTTEAPSRLLGTGGEAPETETLSGKVMYFPDDYVFTSIPYLDFFHRANTSRAPIDGYRACWDPRWDADTKRASDFVDLETSEVGQTNSCRLDFVQAGGKNQMTRGPFYMANLPSNGKQLVPARDTHFLLMCAAERSGYPIGDPAAATYSDSSHCNVTRFRGLNPCLEEDWNTQCYFWGGMRRNPACLNPDRAAQSFVNQQFWASDAGEDFRDKAGLLPTAPLTGATLRAWCQAVHNCEGGTSGSGSGGWGVP